MPRSTKRKRRKRCEECNELFEGESRRCPKCKAKALDELTAKHMPTDPMPIPTEVVIVPEAQGPKPIFVKLLGGTVINLLMIEAINQGAGQIYLGGTKTYRVQPQDLKLIRELVELKEVPNA